MSNYKNLYRGITAAANQRIKKDNQFIKNGTESEPDRGLEWYATDRRREQMKNGEITRAKCVELTQKRRANQLEKDAAAARDKLARIEAAAPAEYIYISVEWVKSSCWGLNPRATVDTHSADGFRTYTGTASGCGYDKESAAVAACFNSSPEILTGVYKLANGRKTIPYGANYKNIFGFPFFDGGVGMSSFVEVLRACGYVLESEHHAKRYDYYSLKKVNERKKNNVYNQR